MIVKKNRVLIRADGNSQMGLGHLVRSIALAHMLKEEFEIIFYCRDIPKSIAAELEKNTFNLEIIQSEEQFFSKINSHHIIVLDGYSFDITYQHKIKEKCHKLVCIDDTYEREFAADLIINHAPGVTPQDYKAQPYTRFALGLEYAILRPAFLKNAKKRRNIKRIETLFICFGGSDPKNLTEYCLGIAVGFQEFKKIIVVTGPVYKPSKTFQKLKRSDSRINHRHNLNENIMSNTIFESDLAIVPASSLVFECIASGCKLISGFYINNQKFLYKSLLKEGLIYNGSTFSPSNIRNAINVAINDAIDSRKYHNIDGKSSERIKKIFKELNNEFFLNLREATIADNEITYNWAKNPLVRKFSFNKHAITKNEHSSWFRKKLEDPDCIYLILEDNNKSIGSLRFDINSKQAIISYLIDPSYHGKNYGLLLIKKGIEYLMDRNSNSLINTVCGYVLKNNSPSIKAFEKLGFLKIKEKDYYKFEKRLWIIQ